MQMQPVYPVYSSQTPSFASTSPDSCPPSGRVCPVCGGPSNGFFFGVPSCRACASFFRRSALERRQYVCRRTNNCSIFKDGMRNSCRACRLNRCIEAGMSIGKLDNSAGIVQSATPYNDLGRASSLETSESTFSAESVSLSVDQQKLHLNISIDLAHTHSLKFAQSSRNIECGQRALVNVLNNSNKRMFGDHQLYVITHDELIQLDRGNITLHLAQVRDIFPEFDQMNLEQKVDILKSSAFHTGIIKNCMDTLRLFPDESPPSHLVIHSCCVISRDLMPHFFNNYADNEERIRLSSPILDRWFSFMTNHFKPLDVSVLEMGAMMGIQLWNCVERHVPLSPEQCAQRNALFVELHSMVAQRCGANAAAIATRFGQLFALMQEAMALLWEMEEIFTMLKIFLPPAPNCWDDLVTLMVEEDKPKSKELGV